MELRCQVISRTEVNGVGCAKKGVNSVHKKLCCAGSPHFLFP